jgi:ribonuclease E
MGKISSFGLMEISRQRRRSGVLEGTTHICEHCAGVGRVLSVESSALSALRGIEMEAVSGGAGTIVLRVPQAVCLYILNEKRPYLERVRLTKGLVVTIQIDTSLAHAEHAIDRIESREFEPSPEVLAAVARIPFDDSQDDLIMDDDDVEDEDDDLIAEDADEADGEQVTARPAQARNAPARSEEVSDDSEAGRRRKRRRRRGRRGDEPSDRQVSTDADEEADQDDDAQSREVNEGGEGGDLTEAQRRRRRRGRRGGRRMREDVRTDEPYGWTRPRAPDGDPYIWFDPLQPRPRPPVDAMAPVEAPAAVITAAPALMASVETTEAVLAEADAPTARPARKRRPAKGRAATADQPEVVAELDAPEPVAEPAPEPATDIWVELPPVDEPKAKPAKARRSRAKAKPEAEAIEAAIVVEAVTEPVAVAPEPAPEPVSQPLAAPDPQAQLIETAAAKPKKGWWRRG